MNVLPTNPQERKAIPITTGVLDYFPAALAEIAKVSKAGNDQHNPGQPLHWARGKSMDQADTLVRHLMERGTLDSDGLRHSAKMAWRALALLQTELEDAGLAPMSRGSRAPEPEIADILPFTPGDAREPEEVSPIVVSGRNPNWWLDPVDEMHHELLPFHKPYDEMTFDEKVAAREACGC